MGLGEELATDQGRQEHGQTTADDQPVPTGSRGTWAGSRDARNLRHLGPETLIDGRLGLVRHRGLHWYGTAQAGLTVRAITQLDFESIVCAGDEGGNAKEAENCVVFTQM